MDCLREIVAPSDETPEAKKLRIAAQWDSDCSFESDSDPHWKTRLFTNYGFSKGLVNVDGELVEDDSPDQADMCEIIRSMIANGNKIFIYIGAIPQFSSDVTNISPEIIKYIDCPGDEGQTEVCAANPGSFADTKSWYIFLDGQSITFNGKPKYILSESNTNNK